VTPSAVAAAAIVVLLALGAVLVRRRLSRQPASRALEIADRALLARDAGVALVRARGELLVVGWGRDGVRLVAHIGRERTP
jgi:flagellar biogenesis protein FliO